MNKGILALVGGDEFHPGNEAVDRLLAGSAAAGPAYVLATAAARQRPELAVKHAQKWFSQFGAELIALPAYTGKDAMDQQLAEAAARGGFFYLTGGDPGLVASVLRQSAVMASIADAWRRGAALAGSSAGAMALCAHVLVRKSFPGHVQRRPVDGTALIKEAAVLPHHNTFGAKWEPSARAALPDDILIGVDERTAAIWEDGKWRATGPGTITVYPPGGDAQAFPSGAEINGIPQPE